MSDPEDPGRPRALISWSCGKDCAWALETVRRSGELELAGLLTTVNEASSRVAMHGIREDLARVQADALGLELWRVPLPWPCPNEVYEARMADAVERARAEGIAHIVFGDLHLADVRAYRERQLAGTGITPVFPLWGRDTAALAAEMLEAGLSAVITCLDPAQLDASFAGRRFDRSLLADLPDGVDPCGENGEFHTFCQAGPMFERRIGTSRGETVERDGFLFTDLLPGGT